MTLTWEDKKKIFIAACEELLTALERADDVPRDMAFEAAVQAMYGLGSVVDTAVGVSANVKPARTWSAHVYIDNGFGRCVVCNRLGLRADTTAPLVHPDEYKPT